jgi:plastocyanin
MKKIFVISLVLLSLLLASCSGGGKPTTSINVSMTDFQFTPNEFTVPTGREISVSALNNGAVVHNLVIMKLGESAGPMFEKEDLANVYWEVEVMPGGDATVTFTAPEEPGEYQIVCRTEGHIASGMVGKLIVVASEEE